MAETSGTPSKLTSSPININAIREDAFTELTDLLSKLPGRILLVLDADLLLPMKLIVVEGSKALKEFKVVDICPLDDDITPASGSLISNTNDYDTILYLIKSTNDNIEVIANHIASFNKRNIRKNLYLQIVPRLSANVDILLKEKNIHDEFSTIGEFSLDIIPVDDDLLSLNLPMTFRDLYVDQDTSSLYSITCAIQKLQSLYGPIPHIRGKGPGAARVVEMLAIAAREKQGESPGSMHASQGGADAPGAPGSSSGSAAPGAASRDDLSSDSSSSALLFSSIQANMDLTSSLPAMHVRVSDKGASGSASEISACILIDRIVDMVTPMVSPLTFEALVDEMYHVAFSTIKVPWNVVHDEAEEAETAKIQVNAKTGAKKVIENPKLPVTVHVNSNDKIWNEIRDVNIESVGAKLAAKAKEIQALQESIKKSQANTNSALAVSEIRQFVKAIPGLQQDKKSLRIFVNILEKLKEKTSSSEFLKSWQSERAILDEDSLKEYHDAITAMISKRTPLSVVLRSLALCNAIEGGFKAKVAEQFRHEIFTSYGVASLPILHVLEASGIFTSKESGGLFRISSSSNAWSTMRKVFSLTSNNLDVESPTDLHFVTSGYAPLSVRLVQAAMNGMERGGWDAGAVADALKQLPGPSVHLVQHLVAQGGAGGGEDGAMGGSGGDGTELDDLSGSSSERKVVLVVFIGGVTHIELTCLRFLSERFAVDYLVLTTAVMNGSAIIKTLLDPFVNAASEDDPEEQREILGIN
jgi:vacuolar protein sorting-associated protein 33A